MTNHNLDKSNWLKKTWYLIDDNRIQYNTGVARTYANTQDGELYNNSQPLKNVNYCFKTLRCLRCYWGPDYISAKIDGR